MMHKSTPETEHPTFRRPIRRNGPTQDGQLREQRAAVVRASTETFAVLGPETYGGVIAARSRAGESL